MQQFGKKPQCRNCKHFKFAEVGDWQFLFWYHEKRHWCKAPEHEHIITHSRCRCQNGCFELKIQN